MKKILPVLCITAALLAGCALFQVAAPLGLPAATCFVLKKEPGSQAYLARAAAAIRDFSKSEKLDAAGLQAALVNVPIDGIPPYASQGIFAIVTTAYKALAEKYATDPDKQEKLRAVLVTLADGISNGISQCGTPATRGGTPKITEASLKTFADSLAGEIKRN